jgi:hypothetical protein
MTSNIKIATWNLCLDLGSKKDLDKHYFLKNKIQICCVQETEISNISDVNLLTFPGYSIEVESNNVNRRVVSYISNRLNFVRRHNLERTNNHPVIINLVGGAKTRIITLYRMFRSQGKMNPKEKFEAQINLIKDAFTNNGILLGDFYIDHSKKFINT